MVIKLNSMVMAHNLNAGWGYVTEVVSADEEWVKLPHGDLGTSEAIAFQIRRNVGGAGVTDGGTPWEEHRRIGVYGLPSVDSAHDHASRVILSSEFDTGARDHAFFSEDAGDWITSYHGAVVEDAYSGSARSFSRTSTGTDTNGNTVVVTYTMRINSDGSLTDTVAAVSEDLVWGERLVSHELLTGASQYSTDGGETFLDIVVDAITVVSSGVILRNPTTGVEVTITCDAHEKAGFVRYYIRQHTGLDRIKFYADFTALEAEALSIPTVTRTSRWRRTAPDPFPPLSYEAESDGLTGVVIHTGAASIDTATTPDTLLLNGDGTGDPYNRVSLILGITEAGDYRITFGGMSTAGDGNGGTNVYVTKATNGSNTTPAPLVSTFIGTIVTAGGFVDFTISDVTGDPIRLLLRQTRAAASANRLRIGSILLQQLPV